MMAPRFVPMVLADMKNIYRDRMQLLAFTAPLFILGLVRFGVPAISQAVKIRTGFDSTPWHPLIESFFLLLPPMMFGMVAGFLLLEDRDEHIIEALAVTPLTGTGYLLYRLTVIVIASTLFSSVYLLFSGMRGRIDPVAVIAVSVAVSFEAPLVPLFLGAFARNKIEGLALAKMSGVVLTGPVIAAFVPLPWQYIGTAVPSYWIARMMFTRGPGELTFWLFFLGSVVVHGGIVLLLAGKFRRKL